MVNIIDNILIVSNVNIYLETVPETVSETSPETSASERVILKIDDYTSLKSDRYPKPYPKGETSWIVESGEGGFGIEIIIKAFDLNSEFGDYVLLQPGNNYTYFIYKFYACTYINCFLTN